MLKVFIAEQVPSSNKGEATLMYGIRKTIQHHSQETVRFYLCSSDQSADQVAYGEDVEILNSPGLIPVAYGISKLTKITLIVWSAFKHLLFWAGYKIAGNSSFILFKDPLWHKYITSDVILIGHDNSFSKYHLFLIFFGLLLKKPVAIYGTTIMPKVLKPSFFAKIGRYLLNRVSLITTREQLTFNFLQEIGVTKPPMYCTADKAFLLDPADIDTSSNLALDILTKKAKGPLLGVMLVKGSNVFKAAFGDLSLSGEIRYQRHIQELAKTLDNLCNKIKCHIVFVPHSIGPKKEADDRLVHQDVAALMQHKEHITLLENDLDAMTLKGLMGKFDMTISERTHGGIASATMNVPTLWISHPGDIRTYGIVGHTLKMSDCLYDISELNSDTLTTKILSIWQDREAVTKRLKTNNQEARDLALKNGYYFNKYCFKNTKDK